MAKKKPPAEEPADPALETFVERVVKEVIDPAFHEGEHGFTYRYGGTVSAADPGNNEVGISIWEQPAEAIGGAEDGTGLYCGYVFDLLRIYKALTDEPRSPRGLAVSTAVSDTRGPHVSICGHFAGTPVLIDIYLNPYPYDDDGMEKVLVDLSDGSMVFPGGEISSVDDLIDELEEELLGDEDDDGEEET
jgi:hypothetical protein